MKIGYLTEADPNDKLPWSGTIHNIYQSMKNAGMEVVWIPVKMNLLIRILMKLGNWVLSRFCGNGDMYHTKLISFLCVKTISKKKLASVDAIFSPAGSVYLAYLKTSKPIVYCTDATFHLLEGYYDYLKSLPQWNIKQGNSVELKALQNATYVLPASDWAAKSIMDDYGISSDKTVVVELGANLEHKDIVSMEIQEKRDNDTLHILFCGVDWERKGGEVACETCIELNKMGIKSCLHIVGVRSIPDIYRDMEMIDFVGFLNKNISTENKRLIALYRNSDIFLLPTRAECAGIVFAEASAFGLPCFTYDTGGIGNYVKNGVNGYRLPEGSSSVDFALKIKECVSDNILQSLMRGCWEMYEKKLNWEVYSRRVCKILGERI